MAVQTRRKTPTNGRARKPGRLTVGSITLPQITEHPVAAIPLFDRTEVFDMLPWSEILRMCQRGKAVAFPVEAADVDAADRAREKFLGCEEFDCRYDGERYWVWAKKHSPWPDCMAPFTDELRAALVVGLLTYDAL